MSFFLKQFNSPTLKTNRGVSFHQGFTALEMITVVTIFSIISATVIFKYSDFRDQVNLQNLSQEIALRVQHAQTAAISGVYPTITVGQNPLSTNPEWRPSYGVMFSTSAPTTPGNFASPTDFVFFFDRESVVPPAGGTSVPVTTLPGYKLYDDFSLVASANGFSPLSSEFLDKVHIDTGDEIRKICIEAACTTPVSNAVVTFRRPFPDAFVVYNVDQTGGGTLLTLQQSLQIKIANCSNQDLGAKIIQISPIGQINISKDPLGAQPIC